MVSLITKSQVTAISIVELITNGYTFTLYNEDTKKFVIFKSKKIKDKTIVWSKIVGCKYTKIAEIYYHNLIVIPEKPTSDIKMRKRYGVSMLVNFWNGITKWTPLGNITFWHACLCRRCGRLLTDPRSIERGIGPACEKKEVKHG